MIQPQYTTPRMVMNHYYLHYYYTLSIYSTLCVK